MNKPLEFMKSLQNISGRHSRKQEILVSKILAFRFDFLKLNVVISLWWHIHRTWCHQRLMTSFEWEQHFTSCLWQCPDCNRAPMKRGRDIAQHIRYHERRQSKIARLNQEH